jgi:hypothetical protein
MALELTARLFAGDGTGGRTGHYPAWNVTAGFPVLNLQPPVLLVFYYVWKHMINGLGHTKQACKKAAFLLSPS